MSSPGTGDAPPGPTPAPLRRASTAPLGQRDLSSDEAGGTTLWNTAEISADSSGAAAGEAVETLYSHPGAKIISFTAGRSALDSLVGVGGGGSSGSSSTDAGSSSRGRSRRSLTAVAEDEPGTLAWSSQFDRTIAVGALSIYRAPGSVAFLSCGSALQPILPKSQCWCIDEASSIFILQIRRPQYWRIELPVGDPDSDERAQRLRTVFDHILQFEKTPCPFKRNFVVALPEQPATPIKKKPWTPVKVPGSAVGTSGTPSTPATPTSNSNSQRRPSQAQEQTPHPVQPQPSRVRSPSPARSDASSVLRQHEFTRREWLAMLESQKKGGATLVEGDFDEFGRRIVPALVAEHEQRIQDAKASEIEVSKMGVPWRNNSVPGASPASHDGTARDRSLSLASDLSAALHAEPVVVDSPSSAFNSLRSWLSSVGGGSGGGGGGRRSSMLFSSSPPSSISVGSGDSNVPPALAALFEDARRIFASSVTEEQPQQAPQPPLSRFRHRATTSSISAVSDHHAALPPAVSILTPYRQLQITGPTATRMEEMRRIPGTILYRVLEMLLRPPRYLLALMLRIAARIMSGEWRGFVVGQNTSTGESIPVKWDYSDLDDPLGRVTTNSELSRVPKSAFAARSRGGGSPHAVDRLNVYTEADVEVYTDAEDIDDGDDDDERDIAERCFSASPSSPKRAARSDHDTLSDAGGDPVVWTRRWAVD